MIDLAVYNREGKEVESLQVDESALGGHVRYVLLKQAIVMYHANKRVGTAATKSRGMVQGSTRKLSAEFSNTPAEYLEISTSPAIRLSKLPTSGNLSISIPTSPRRPSVI